MRKYLTFREKCHDHETYDRYVEFFKTFNKYHLKRIDLIEYLTGFFAYDINDLNQLTIGAIFFAHPHPCECFLNEIKRKLVKISKLGQFYFYEDFSSEYDSYPHKFVLKRPADQTYLLCEETDNTATSITWNAAFIDSTLVESDLTDYVPSHYDYIICSRSGQDIAECIIL